MYESSNCSTYLPTFVIVFFIKVIFSGFVEVTNLVFMCISLIANDTEQFSCVYWQFGYFGGKYPQKSFSHFLIGLSFYNGDMSSLYIPDTYPHHINHVQII